MKYIKFNYYDVLQIIIVILLLVLGNTKLEAQLKIGNNPKKLSPNVLLEIEATSGNSAVFSKDSAYIGIGTKTPTHRLHIQSSSTGAVKIVDGTQAEGRVLTSDANGIATWRVPFVVVPQNLTNSNGIIITGGNGATLTATSLRLDSTAVAKMMTQSPAKDSITSVVNTVINNGNGITGKNTTAGSLISIINGAGSALKDHTISVDTSAMKSFIATNVNNSPIKDSLSKVINNQITSGSITGQNLTNSNGIIVMGGTGTTIKATSLRLDSTAVAKMMSQSPVKDSINAVLNTQSITVKNVSIKLPLMSVGDVGSRDYTLAGVAIGDNVVANPRIPLPYGVNLAYVMVSAANTITFGFTGTGSNSALDIPFDIKVFK